MKTVLERMADLGWQPIIDPLNLTQYWVKTVDGSEVCRSVAMFLASEFLNDLNSCQLAYYTDGGDLSVNALSSLVRRGLLQVPRQSRPVAEIDGGDS